MIALVLVSVCVVEGAHEPTCVWMFPQAPGFVSTNWGTEMPWIVRGLLSLVRPFGRSLADCGEAMCVPLFSPGAGLVLVNKDGSSEGVTVTPEHTAEAREVVWRHTLEVLGRNGITEAGAGPTDAAPAPIAEATEAK